MNYQKNYYPRRPVKSFRDLEVYQKLLAVSVVVAKRILTVDNSGKLDDRRSKFDTPPSTVSVDRLPSSIVNIALGLPVKIAEAHSIRFSRPPAAIEKLEEVMLDCNVLAVYLEQYRDIENPSTGEAGKEIESEFFEEQIKNIVTVRGKVLRLQFSWKKFMAMKSRGAGKNEISRPLTPPNPP